RLAGQVLVPADVVAEQTGEQLVSELCGEPFWPRRLRLRQRPGGRDLCGAARRVPTSLPLLLVRGRRLRLALPGAYLLPVEGVRRRWWTSAASGRPLRLIAHAR